VIAVEHHSTTRWVQRSAAARAVRLAGAVVVTAVVVSALPSNMPAGADPLATARAQAAQIAAQIQAQGQRLSVLSEQFDVAQLRVGQLDSQLNQTRAAIAQTQAQVATDEADLRAQALDAYMAGGNELGLETLFAGGNLQSAASSEYRDVAGGNLSGALDNLRTAKLSLAGEQTQLQSTEQGARAALAQADAAKQGAAATLSSQQSTLDHVKGQVAALVAQQQAAAAAAQAAAFQARLAAARTAAAAAAPGKQGFGPAPPPAPGGAGGKAVAAAESQIGVPYVYGGATPGVGFDCSGLTMWAWHQAGVSLSHSAAAQYAETSHVPLGDLQPGDLLFYDEGGTIGHVTMYVGPGEMIQAESTGTRVQITGIWSSGLVGAGRP
jgi:cell wall-associated NlpC family hydrolase